MGECRIIKISEEPGLTEQAAQWFHEKWQVPVEAYCQSMLSAIAGDPIQEWYVVLDEGKIIAGAGVIANDFHDQKDLSPNVCAVYTEPAYRRLGLAGRLLDFIVTERKEKGVTPIYLLTDHTNFYERYGWEYLCMAQNEGENHQSRIYLHR